MGEVMAYDLEFEKPLAELERKISGLQRRGDRLKPDEHRQLQEAERELHRRTEEIYRNLSAWETVQVARHKDRPHALDYIHLIFDDFFELHGDRAFNDDHAIVAGPAKLDDETVMLVCHQKGRDVKENQFRNFGMSHPEGYRKAGRLMLQAEKFGIPVICLIDTPAAFPGLEDEEHGQAEAIASNLYLMSRLRIPTVGVVTTDLVFKEKAFTLIKRGEAFLYVVEVSSGMSSSKSPVETPSTLAIFSSVGI